MRSTTLSNRIFCAVARNRTGLQNSPSSGRFMSTLTPPNKKSERREVHSTAGTKSPDVTAAELKTSNSTKVAALNDGVSTVASRFLTTAEVTVSKIFPAGFGWQTSSIIAENNFGFAPDTMNFALTTGLGDALGVVGGHCLYYGAKKAITKNDSINMESEVQTGLLLGSAAFCSGTAWQPLVDALQGANCSFGGVFAGTWAGCGLAFYAGLRAGRTILSGFMTHIEEPTYDNSKNDASLSCVIGGATGFFVGTDAAYLPDQNFLINFVGITDGTPDLVGCAIAGTSTSMGFFTSQSVFNVIYPSGKCWND
uniref:Uncharacterized protein n=1 Tax=Pseudo-nitzschia multistriata TaxID=183589 RepID=A0A448ZS93_9STRA